MAITTRLFSSIAMPPFRPPDPTFQSQDETQPHARNEMRLYGIDAADLRATIAEAHQSAAGRARERQTRWKDP